MERFVKFFFLYSAWLVALLGSAMSLYYGEVLHIEPCRLCWYQRIALFPLAWILGLALYRNECQRVILYAVPFAMFGVCVSAYQSLMIRIPAWQAVLDCAEECTKPVFVMGSWLTLPDVSAAGFIAIFVFLMGARGWRKKDLVS